MLTHARPLAVKPRLRIGRRGVRLIRALLTMEIRLTVPHSAGRRRVVRSVSRPKTLHRRPGFDQRAIDREMIRAKQALHLGLSSAGGNLHRPLSCASCRRRSRRPPSSQRCVPQSIPVWRQRDPRSFAGFESLVDERCGERAGSRIPNRTARPLIWFSTVTGWPTSFLRAMISGNANMRLVHRTIEASKIVHRSVSSSTSWPNVSAFAEELSTITRC